MRQFFWAEEQFSFVVVEKCGMNPEGRDGEFGERSIFLRVAMFTNSCRAPEDRGDGKKIVVVA